jgi:hypothetical protein
MQHIFRGKDQGGEEEGEGEVETRVDAQVEGGGDRKESAGPVQLRARARCGTKKREQTHYFLMRSL